jgi:mono/diheme cytochrome c family protein
MRRTDRIAVRARLLALVVAFAAAATAGAGCEFGIPAGQEPHFEFNWTDMGDQPKVKPQRPDLLGLGPWGTYAPPAGAVATGEHPYRFTQAEAELAARGGASPHPTSPALLAKGEWVWTHSCVVCHGPQGAGDGHLTKKFPAPPSLLRQKVRDDTDARIFHVPMRGQNSMPSHSKQLEPEELWAVVAYIRDLQSKLPVAPPTKQDLEAAAVQPGTGAQTP